MHPTARFTLTQTALRFASSACLGLLLAVVAATSARAQGDIPSGNVYGYGSGPSYNYSLSFYNSASATQAIGSVWYAWIPFAFYLPGTPTGASAPTGWTASVNGASVEYVASSSIYDIAPGQSLSGFGYTATFSPATLAGTANSGLSDAYTGGIESDAGKVFTVVAVPEPSAVLMLLSGVTGLCWVLRRKSSC